MLAQQILNGLVSGMVYVNTGYTNAMGGTH